MITRVNIYRAAGEWCYAAFDDDGFDCSDTIGCFDDASEDDARADIAEMFPDAEIRRLSDCDVAGRDL